MTQVTVHQAKTNLSKLIAKVLQGEKVVIARGREPVVSLQAIAPEKSKRKLGWAKNLVSYVAPDFDEELEDFQAYMYTDQELAKRRPKKKRT